jgi:hypothetical protein
MTRAISPARFLQLLRGVPVGVPTFNTSRRLVTPTPGGCPRCGGYVYRNIFPVSGGLVVSNCVNCGWQGDYSGAPVDETTEARERQRIFDFDLAQERIRRSLRAFQAKKGRTRGVL